VEELLLSVIECRVTDVGQIDIHTRGPEVPDPSLFEVEIVISKLKNYKSSFNDQIMIIILNGLKQGDAISALFSDFALEYAIRKVQEN
jgi:hypothetical protein